MVLVTNNYDLCLTSKASSKLPECSALPRSFLPSLVSFLVSFCPGTAYFSARDFSRLRDSSRSFHSSFLQLLRRFSGTLLAIGSDARSARSYLQGLIRGGSRKIACVRRTFFLKSTGRRVLCLPALFLPSARLPPSWRASGKCGTENSLPTMSSEGFCGRVFSPHLGIFLVLLCPEPTDILALLLLILSFCPYSPLLYQW